MPTITAIKSQKNQSRVNIYLDGKFGFGLDLENFVKLGLKVEQELSDLEVDQIIKKAEFQKTLDKLFRFATLRPRSEKEVSNWYRRKKVHQSLHLKLSDKLKKLDLIDDYKFAKWWVDQRLEFKPKPKRILKQELIIKGIKKDIIEDILSETVIDEAKIAQDELEKRLPRLNSLPKLEARKKITDYLLRKGFDWDTVKKLIDKVLGFDEY